jgi:type VI secretion system protein ImpA
MDDELVVEVAPLPDLTEDAPAGENLELHSDFGALERAAQGRPETQYGDTINAAIPPDWRETEALALNLLERTRDLRVLTYLAVARLHLTGLSGFAEVLSQIRWQLESRWEHVHPQLDPEDANDPTLRANALLRLRDPTGVLRCIRDLPIADTPRGTVSWRDIAAARGLVEPEPGRNKLTEAFIRGAFQATSPARLRTLRSAADQVMEEIQAIPRIFEAQAGDQTGPNFDDLVKLVDQIRTELRTVEEVTEPTKDAAVTEPAPDDLPAPAAHATLLPSPSPPPITYARSTTTVSSREDALRLLELAASYFRQNEPSSPLPMLIDRARRLGRMEFMDILRDIAPEGLVQAELVAGRTTDAGTEP